MSRRPLTAPPAAPHERSPHRRWASCIRGELPAEALSTRDREDLTAHLVGLGWTDREIAQHTRMTLHTTARIRQRLGLNPNTQERHQ